MIRYKGYHITPNQKRIDRVNPISGHEWSEYKDIPNSFSVTGFMAFHTYRFKTIKNAKKYIDALIGLNGFRFICDNHIRG